MRTDLEAQPHHTPVLRKAFAAVVLVVVAALAVKLVIGFVIAIFWAIVAVAAVLAVIWALKTLVW
jgi:flagellar biosynthesis protein FliQ